MTPKGTGTWIAIALWSAVATAAPKHKPWGEWNVSGSGCRPQSIETVQNGDTLAVLFNEFGIRMPAGESGDGTAAKRDCHFKIFLQAPPGMELAGVSQLYSGGVVKSARARGRLALRYHVGSIQGREHPLVWKQGEAITPEDPRSIFSHSSDADIDPPGCAKKAVFHVKLVLTGERAAIDEYFIGGVDSFDAQFKHRVRVNARWKPCRPRGNR